MSTQVEERVSRAAARPRRARRTFGLSIPEIGVIAVTLLVFIWSLIYYYTALSPVQSRLRTQEQELQRINSELSQTTGGPSGSKGPNVKEALASLQAFKSDDLKPLSSGRITLLNEINALAKKHSVTLTSGIEMPLDKGRTEETVDDSKTKKKASEVLNAFPHLDLHFAVFGQYPAIRAFLNDLEHNKQFFIIKSVNLAMQEEKGGGGGGTHHGSRVVTGSGLVLTVEAAAYFQP